MSEASDRLSRQADEFRALAQEHGDSNYELIELILRIVSEALADEHTELEAA